MKDLVSAAYEAFRDELLGHGLLISMGVDGLYGRSGTFEHVVERLNAAISGVGDPDGPEVMRFPPGLGRLQLEKSGYVRNFPHLAGTVASFAGSDHDHAALLGRLSKGEDWTDMQRPTEVALTPAACYGVYPTIASRGPLAATGALVDVYTWCFRHEPSIDPARMQMFRQREHVRIGTREQVSSFRTLWLDRAQALVGSLELPATIEVASDPFFGRAGKLLSASQREESLKFELLVPIVAEAPRTACVSFNDHRDLFGRAWAIQTETGETAHTACVGFGVERLTLALFRHHGFIVADWPDRVRHVLGL
ncbi:MAG: amino acid--[acyl-carrier-protein] ligase [Reyranella sp.]|nr:MAG: amino acid--[acyl-carrier-protein] ligase [Reyranella sp.]TBR26042.1 MAG: amino acid--[acyl-carrier-protein] ligase [Reyranella sp.]